MTFSQRGFDKEQFVFPRKKYKNKSKYVCASVGGHLGARQLLSSNVLGRKTPQVSSKQIFMRELGPASRIWVHNFGCVPPVIEDEMPLEVLRGAPFVASRLSKLKRQAE